MKILSIPSMRLSGLTQNITTKTSLFLALNLIDFILTTILISGGMGVEGNPLLGSSIWSIGLIKLLACAIVLHYFYSRHFIMRAINIGLSLVVAWNLFWLLMLV